MFQQTLTPGMGNPLMRSSELQQPNCHSERKWVESTHRHQELSWDWEIPRDVSRSPKEDLQEEQVPRWLLRRTCGLCKELKIYAMEVGQTGAESSETQPSVRLIN